MPYCKIDHIKACKIICAACGIIKVKNCLDIEKNKTILNLVNETANEGLDINNLSEPKGLCKYYKSYLYLKKKGNINELRKTKLLLEQS